MCDFSTSAATASSVGNIGIGTQAAGVGLSTVGAFYSAQGQKDALNAQAGVADINARLSEDTAQSVMLAGQKQQQQILLKGAQVKSTQRASMAANGVDLGVGSAVAVQDSTDVITQSDSNTTAANALRQAWGYRTQGVNYKNAALMDRAQSSSISPWMAGGGTLLTGASSLAKNFYNLKKSGASSFN